jgi:hypothetical protein
MVQVKHCASKKEGMGMDNILLMIILVLSLIIIGVLLFKMFGKKTEKYVMIDEQEFVDALTGKKNEIMEEEYLESRKN